MVNKILIEVLASIAQQERETIRQRQAEGIAAAKAKGKHLGRPRAERPGNWNEVIAAVLSDFSNFSCRFSVKFSENS